MLIEFQENLNNRLTPILNSAEQKSGVKYLEVLKVTNDFYAETTKNFPFEILYSSNMTRVGNASF